VESRSAASEVEAATATGSSLVDLSEEYSVTEEIPVVQDWVPYQLLANKDVSAACQTLAPGGTSTINDPTAVKNLGYWLIEVIDRDDVGAIKTRAILAGSLEDAERAKARLATGEDFVTVAEQYSQIYSATENAEFDWISPEDVVTETFNAAAFELELNVVSEPIVEREIQTNGAYWVVRLLERETRVLSETISDAMASVAFDAWYGEYSQTAVVEQLLTPQQKAFAVERVTS
jgi:parvulin-like peptidyl-prolyl isomerase